MTIKEFAAICRCNAQTLRYYDRIDLLKPARVDQWTGYRHYDAAQATDFVKIKNLQAADFSIEEIRTLLTRPDEAVYAAFEEKIAAQEEKLAQIRAIQQTYLREKNTMEQIIHSLSDFVLSLLADPEGLREFGLTPEDAPRVTAEIRRYLETAAREHIRYPEELTLTVGEEAVQGAEAIARRIEQLDPDDLPQNLLLNDSPTDEPDFSPDQYESLWEKHGWQHVSEWLEEMPLPEEGGEYCFFFRLADAKAVAFSFPMYMLAAVILKKGPVRCIMSASVQDSRDGENHFALLRKPQEDPDAAALMSMQRK